MRNFFSRPSPESTPEDQAPQRPMSQRPAPRTSRSAAALFAAYGALTGAEGCIPQANTPRISNAEWREAELARRANQERRRVQELPVISTDEVRRAIYGAFDPENPHRREIAPNAAVASGLSVREGRYEDELPPGEIMSPLSPRAPGDPTEYHGLEERRPNTFGANPGFYSDAIRLHEGERLFGEVLSEAIRARRPLRITYREAISAGAGAPDRTGNTPMEFHFNWNTTIMEPVENTRTIAEAEGDWERVSEDLDSTREIHFAVMLACKRFAVRQDNRVPTRLTLEGRLPGAVRATQVHGWEAQVLLRNIDIQRVVNNGGQSVLRITADRLFIYRSSQSPLIDRRPV